MGYPWLPHLFFSFFFPHHTYRAVKDTGSNCTGLMNSSLLWGQEKATALTQTAALWRNGSLPQKDFSVEKPREIFPMKVIVQLRLVWFVNYWLCAWQVGLAHRQTRARPRGWFWNQTGPFDFYQTEIKNVLSSMNTDQREAIPGQVLTAHKLFIKPRCTFLKNVARLSKKGCFAGENGRV